MENSPHMAEPLPAVRPKGAHRFEVFSPKLARRLTFFRRALVDAWILLEADPFATRFCERPGYVQVDEQRRLADFWVEFVDHQELVILDEFHDAAGDTGVGRTYHGAGLSVRRVVAADLAAARMWIDNWQRMLPSVVANRGLIPASLLVAIERFVRTPQPLLAIERELSTGDPALIRAALFSLLHAGRVRAPELHTQALSLMTSFVAKESDS
jgi:hypothetical protein